jgi:hypothetical protein
MKRLTLLFAVLLAGAAHADSNGLCKSLCETSKRECRSDAASQTSDEALTLLTMTDRNPNARVAKGLADKPSEAQSRQSYESRRVKMQRACDTQYPRCVQACGKQEAAAPDAKAGQQ